MAGIIDGVSKCWLVEVQGSALSVEGFESRIALAERLLYSASDGDASVVRAAADRVVEHLERDYRDEPSEDGWEEEP